MIKLPTYHEGGAVPRGKATDWLWRQAEFCRFHIVDHDALTGEDRNGHGAHLGEARALWDQDDSTQMVRIKQGPFVFVIMGVPGYTRVTIWGMP